MDLKRWLGVIAAGLASGVVAVLAMTLLLTIGRFWLGISPPPEAIPDRFAPTIEIDRFFDLFGRFGGYNGLKKFGIRAGIAGLAAVGALIGVAYAVVAQRARARGERPGRRGVGRSGVVFVAAAAVVLWLATLVLLAPVLDANYRGLPPSYARPATALWLLVAYAAYGLALIAAYRFLAGPARGEEDTAVSGATIGRRSVTIAGVGVLLALPSFALIRRLYDRATFGYDGRAYSGPGVQPIAPNDAFYSVTKNVVDPDVTTAVWALEVDGLVEEARRYRFKDLVAIASVDQESTLMCISNQIGSGLFSNALWRGVPMRVLLERSGVRDGAVEVRLSGADGYVDTFAIEKARDPTTLVVYEMNGEPLPQRHGYPARVVVPGLFGEKNVKWVTRIEVIDHDAKGFYEQQGWGPNFEIPTRSDIFSPRWSRDDDGDAFADPFPLAETATIRGRSFAGARGVSGVEVSTDDGETWREARIDYPGTSLTWVFWSFDWTPDQPGAHVLVSRAVDGTGAPQPSKRQGIVPQGAQGYHRVTADVASA